MMSPGGKTPIYSREAKLDIKDAARWFQRTYSPAVAQQFLRAIRECVTLVAEFPRAHEVVYGYVRKAVAQGVPYSVFYFEEDGQVTVIAVMHWRRDPRDWQVRVR